jgi:hypothetical protein
MTATNVNAVFVKDGVTITVMTTPDYTENYNKAGLKKIPSPVTKDNRITDPSDPDYGLQNKGTIIDLGINPERRLTINGYLITETGTFTDTYGPAIDKKNALTRMFISGGNVTLTLETGGVHTFFQTVIVDKWEFKKVPIDGQESTYDGIVEYSCIISMEDSSEYGS